MFKLSIFWYLNFQVNDEIARIEQGRHFNFFQGEGANPLSTLKMTLFFASLNHFWLRFPKLNIIGRKAIAELKIDMSNLLHNHVSKIDEEYDSKTVEKACHKICQDFKECFEQELGCLKDFELEVKFKPEAASIFVKTRIVPFSIQEDLNHALDAGIKKGIWSPTHFNDYGTPIVLIRRSLRPGEKKADIRIVNSQLEPHKYPMPLSCHLLEQDFAHFGYPHTLVTDNAPTFTSEEFQEFLRERGILWEDEMRGASYHPATNGQAERLVQTFKQSLRKSRLQCIQTGGNYEAN